MQPKPLRHLTPGFVSLAFAVMLDDVEPEMNETIVREAKDAAPADLAAVALIDASRCAEAGGMSVAWWHREVAAGRAPQPAVRRPRCTRWRASAVVAFWRNFGEAAL